MTEFFIIISVICVSAKSDRSSSSLWFHFSIAQTPHERERGSINCRISIEDEPTLNLIRKVPPLIDSQIVFNLKIASEDALNARLKTCNVWHPFIKTWYFQFSLCLNLYFYIYCILFFIYFWCAPFGYLYFQFFCNVIASNLLTSIQYTVPGFEPTIAQPLGHEPSALTTRTWLLA